jgi:hypothetical protein
VAAFGEVRRDAEADATAGSGHERTHGTDVHRFAFRRAGRIASVKRSGTASNVVAISAPQNPGELSTPALPRAERSSGRCVNASMISSSRCAGMARRAVVVAGLHAAAP